MRFDDAIAFRVECPSLIQESVEATGQLIVARSDPTEWFEPVEETLDQMPGVPLVGRDPFGFNPGPPATPGVTSAT
jgi:hypothetical protein